MNNNVNINGWLILDKPSGITSAHAVAKVKRLLSSLRAEGAAIQPGREAGLPRRSAPRNDVKIGHAGTLDPLASGVLPLALGEATKTVPYMMDADKEYGFTVRWGEERDTDDSEGVTLKTSDKSPILQEIQELLPKFIGEIEQRPPNYSAIKQEGKRAYDRARGGEEFVLAGRRVRVDSLYIAEEKLGMDPGLRRDDSFICRCGKGTYIRSLARDMGRELGCYGHITQLRRLRVGKCSETHAISLCKLEEMVHKGGLGFILPVDIALDDIPAWNISSDQALRLRRGQTIPDFASAAPMLRAMHEGTLVAICERAQGLIKSVRVFNL